MSEEKDVPIFNKENLSLDTSMMDYEVDPKKLKVCFTMLKHRFHKDDNDLNARLLIMGVYDFTTSNKTGTTAGDVADDKCHGFTFRAVYINPGFLSEIPPEDKIYSESYLQDDCPFYYLAPDKEHWEVIYNDDPFMGLPIQEKWQGCDDVNDLIGKFKANSSIP